MPGAVASREIVSGEAMKTRTLGGLTLYSDDKERDHGLPPCESAKPLGSLSPARQAALARVVTQLDEALPTGMPIALDADDCIHCGWPMAEHALVMFN
jgi:hypothetical protein